MTITVGADQNIPEIVLKKAAAVYLTVIFHQIKDTAFIILSLAVEQGVVGNLALGAKKNFKIPKIMLSGLD